MNRTELFEEVKCWLEGEKLMFAPDEEDRDFCVRMHIENGLVMVRLVCEESPAMLQAVCTFPVKVPKDKTAATGLFLHSLNSQLRMGAFHLDPKGRLVQFRLAMPIRQDSELNPQFAEAFGVALSTVDDAFHPLCLFLCASKKAQKTVAKHSPAKEAVEEEPQLPRNRLEFN